MFFLIRFITREELRQAMTKYGMGDDATIDEVIQDVDTDRVIIIFLFIFFFLNLFLEVVFFRLIWDSMCRTGESTMKSLQP